MYYSKFADSVSSDIKLSFLAIPQVLVPVSSCEVVYNKVKWDIALISKDAAV